MMNLWNSAFILTQISEVRKCAGAHTETSSHFHNQCINWSKLGELGKLEKLLESDEFDGLGIR